MPIIAFIMSFTAAFILTWMSLPPTDLAILKPTQLECIERLEEVTTDTEAYEYDRDCGHHGIYYNQQGELFYVHQELRPGSSHH